MTIVEYLEKSFPEDQAYISSNKINHGFLWTNIETIKKLDEFKNVKKINILQYSKYNVSTITGAPAIQEDYLWETYKPEEVVSVKLGDIELSDEIDLFSMEVSAKIYVPHEATKCGVWVWPLVYNPFNFSPHRKIEIIFSCEQMQDIYSNDMDVDRDPKNVILKRVAHALDKMEPNIPSYRNVIIRCSARSIKQKENE